MVRTNVFPMFLNSKATLLDIMCIKISGHLPWVKNYQQLRNRLDKYAMKVLKENEVVGHVSNFKVLYLHSFVWGDYKM